MPYNETLIAQFEAVKEVISGIRKIFVGLNCNADEKWDICLESEFDSLKDVSFYAQHPDQPTSWHFTPLETSFSREVSFRNKDGVNEEELYKRFLGTPLPCVCMISSRVGFIVFIFVDKIKSCFVFDQN